VRTVSRLLCVAICLASVLELAFAKSSSSVSVASSLNPSTYGSSVKFTATVTPSAATGTVTFKDGSTTLGTGTLSGGKATYTTSALTTGSHSMTAVYGGDSNYNGSTSSALTQTVNKASTTTAVSSSANPSTFGASVTFTATVTPSTATGTVTFKDGSTTLGTGTLSSGRATYSTATLSGGSHSITAVYGGDSNYNASTSSTLTQTVNKANTTTTVASSANPSAYGSSVTFTATVTPSTATGTVTFKDGTTTLGTGTISSGTASYSTSTLAVGSHSIKATYSGDSNYNTSTSSTLTQTVKQPSSVALTSSANPAPYGSALTFTASVTPSAATGTVTFYDGGTALGSGTLASGFATYSTSALTIGSHSISAVYGGNSTYAGCTSPVLTQNILSISSIAVTPSMISLAVGATQPLIATATYSDNSQGNITSLASWTSSDVTIATVSTSGVATGVAEGTASIQAAVGSVSGSASVTGTPSRFRLTGSLNTPRSDFTATLLQNGQVLIAGGWDWNLGAPTAKAELYNPVTGTFAYTGSLYAARDWHTATLLQNGMVLITGGNSVGRDGYPFSQTAAELYDPTTGTFSYTGSLNLGRADQTATLLQNGQVLITGGYDSIAGAPTATAELYDPSTGTFAYTGSLSTPTWNHSATLLNDATVLIAGGDSQWGQSPIAVAAIYNPATAAFTTVGNLKAAREYHTSTLLGTGKVLIVGGANTQSGDSQAQYLATAELYDPVARTFSFTGNLAYARGYATANLLNNGQVLIVGGDGAGNNGFMGLGPAELYDPAAATFSIPGNLNIPRAEHGAALLSDGTVLIAGGGGERYYFEDGYSVEAVPQAEIYQTPGSQIQPPDSLQITPATATVTVEGTQHFTAMDSNGYPRQDVTWTVSDPSLASVAADENDAGVLTGIAVGQVTLTANAENVTGQAQVTISPAGVLVPGTVVWSIPPVPGFSAQQIVQAVPTGGGPDLYSITGNGTQSIVQALTADGRQLWQTTLPALNNNSVPDGGGGLLVTEYDTCTPGQTSPLTVFDLDPWYGRPQIIALAAGVQQGNGVVYCYGGGDAPQIAVRGDGAVIISEPTNNGFPQLTMQLPNNGRQTIYDLEPPSTITTPQGQIVAVQCCVGPPMVNTDGTVYVEWESRQMGQTKINSDTLYWFQINPDNSIGGGILSSTTQNEALLPGSIVSDGQGGVLATWTISPSSGPVPQYPYQAVKVSGGVVGTPYNLPFSPQTVGHGQTPSIVLGENGTGFAAGNSTSTDGLNNAVSQIVSFSLASGTPNWTYQETPGNSLSLIVSTAGNGLVAKSTDQSGNDTVLTFDSSGGTQSQLRRGSEKAAVRPILQAGLSGLSSIDYYSEALYLGFIGNLSAAVSGNLVLEASAPGTRPKGDAQHNGTTDPGLALVGTQDCHKVSQDKTIVARYPIYRLRSPSTLTQELPCSTDSTQCYTVFEYIPQNQTGCGPAGYNNLNPCNYTNGARVPFNEFDDEITAGNSGTFNKMQYFDYGIPNQRLWGVKQIYRTLQDGTTQRKQPNTVFNQLQAAPAADPLIDGQLDPWLAWWDGRVDSCNSTCSQYFRGNCQ